MNLDIRGQVYADGKLREATVRIRDGLIAGVLEADEVPGDRQLVLGPRQLLLPSAIDLQCALRDWGEAERETVETATRAALAGGVTVVCDQANTVPRINSACLVRKRAEYLAERSYCDYVVAAHPPAVDSEMEKYREAGAGCIQHFPWDLRPWRYPRDIDDSRRSFARCASFGLSGMVIADELSFEGTEWADRGEAYAVAALLRRLDESYRVRVSVTEPESVEALWEEKGRLPNMSIQVPHHALFADRESAYGRIGSAATHVPPLRSAAAVNRLQELTPKIDIVVSFHAPHRLPDKYSSEAIGGEFTPKAGYSAVEIAYSHLLTRLGIEQACRCFCERPAEHLGLNAGRIAKGAEANLVIVERDSGAPEQNIHVTGSSGDGIWKIDPSRFHTRATVTPFVGERLSYRVLKTFIRGEEAFDRVTDTFARLDTRRVGSVSEQATSDAR